MQYGPYVRRAAYKVADHAWTFNWHEIKRFLKIRFRDIVFRSTWMKYVSGYVKREWLSGLCFKLLAFHGADTKPNIIHGELMLGHFSVSCQ